VHHTYHKHASSIQESKVFRIITAYIYITIYLAIPLSPTLLVHQRFNPAPNLSISLPSAVPTPAAALSLSTAATSFALTASSAALTRIPHFSHISITTLLCRFGAAFGINSAASFGFPALRIRLKKGSQPMGDLRVLERVSSSAQSRFDTSARSLGWG
jgi:hypothetical protein